LKPPRFLKFSFNLNFKIPKFPFWCFSWSKRLLRRKISNLWISNTLKFRPKTNHKKEKTINPSHFITCFYYNFLLKNNNKKVYCFWSDTSFSRNFLERKISILCLNINRFPLFPIMNENCLKIKNVNLNWNGTYLMAQSTDCLEDCWDLGILVVCRATNNDI
jgi:hypothetical protein